MLNKKDIELINKLKDALLSINDVQEEVGRSARYDDASIDNALYESYRETCKALAIFVNFFSPAEAKNITKLCNVSSNREIISRIDNCIDNLL